MPTPATAASRFPYTMCRIRPPRPATTRRLRCPGSAAARGAARALRPRPRGASVDVPAETHDSPVRIRVADRGLGIDAEDLPHIFKPFYRGRPAIDAEARGAG